MIQHGTELFADAAALAPAGCSIIIPASNEARFIAPTLGALLASNPPETGASPAVEIVVVANGCQDETVAVARGFAGPVAARGWRLAVLELAEGGKLNALNAGDVAATAGIRIYLDADVVASPGLVAELAAALERDAPAYASGTPAMAPAASWVTRAYTRVWRRVPFMTTGVPGCCVFATNAAGRRRWGTFPPIVADDTFVRLQFAAAERIRVPATYAFPMPEGFRRLVTLRRRQDFGARDVARRYPALVANDDKPRFGAGLALRIATTDPLGFAAYAAVAVAARFRARRHAGLWARARQL